MIDANLSNDNIASGVGNEKRLYLEDAVPNGAADLRATDQRTRRKSSRPFRSEGIELLTQSILDLAYRSSRWKTKKLMYKFRLTTRTRRVTRSNNRTLAIDVLTQTTRSNEKNFEMKEKSDGSTKEKIRLTCR